MAVFTSAQQQARQFQIRAQETKKSDKDSELSPATLHQQLRARQLQQSQQQQQQQQPSASAASYEYSDEEEENVPAQAQTYQRQTSQQRQYVQQQQYSHPQQGKKQLTKKQREELEEELEEEEPDHLALMLAKSQFSCNERTTGYYADDTVGCQIFHYCSDNTKHSWIW